MRPVKDNEGFDFARNRIIELFSRNDLYFSSEAHFCFVCGGSSSYNNNQPKLRSQFIEWAKSNEKRLVCVTAESAVLDLMRQVESRHKNTNLAKVEEFIATAVHSLLIFPESPGSFAELGLFSANKKISRNTLVALEMEWQGDSFITLGPIKSINSITQFNSIALSQPYSIPFRQISDRLLGIPKNVKPYRKKYAHLEWKSKSFEVRHKLAVLDFIIDIIGICTEEDLFDIIMKVFGRYERNEVRLLIALLNAMERIKRTDNSKIARINFEPRVSFIEGANEAVFELKVKWRECYLKYELSALTELENILK